MKILDLTKEEGPTTISGSGGVNPSKETPEKTQPQPSKDTDKVVAQVPQGSFVVPTEKTNDPVMVKLTPGEVVIPPTEVKKVDAAIKTEGGTGIGDLAPNGNVKTYPEGYTPNTFTTNPKPNAIRYEMVRRQLPSGRWIEEKKAVGVEYDPGVSEGNTNVTIQNPLNGLADNSNTYAQDKANEELQANKKQEIRDKRQEFAQNFYEQTGRFPSSNEYPEALLTGYSEGGWVDENTGVQYFDKPKGYRADVYQYAYNPKTQEWGRVFNKQQGVLTTDWIPKTDTKAYESLNKNFTTQITPQRDNTPVQLATPKPYNEVKSEAPEKEDTNSIDYLTRGNDYVNALEAILQTAKPVRDPVKEERYKKRAAFNAVGQGLKTVFEGVNHTRGMNVSPNQTTDTSTPALKKLTDDYEAKMENYKGMLVNAKVGGLNYREQLRSQAEQMKYAMDVQKQKNSQWANEQAFDRWYKTTSLDQKNKQFLAKMYQDGQFKLADLVRRAGESKQAHEDRMAALAEQKRNNNLDYEASMNNNSGAKSKFTKDVKVPVKTANGQTIYLTGTEAWDVLGKIAKREGTKENKNNDPLLGRIGDNSFSPDEAGALIGSYGLDLIGGDKAPNEWTKAMGSGEPKYGWEPSGYTKQSW